MSCIVIYGDNGSILGTQTPKEEPSKLFPEVLNKVINSKRAADLVALTYTERFTEQVIMPLKSRYRNAVKKSLDSLQPGNNIINIVLKGKEYPFDLKNLQYKTVDVKGFTTVQAFAKIGEDNVMLGKVRMKPYKDGMAVESSNLTAVQTYNNGNLEGLQGKGIGTEIYKYAILKTLRQNKNFYSDQNQSASATGVWEKLKTTKFVKREEGRNKIESIPSSHFDSNGEVLPQVLFSFLRGEQAKGKTLTFEQKQDIKNTLISSPFADSQEMADALEKTFFNESGEFVVDESKLKEVYSDYEILNIKSDKNLQKSIKNVIEGLRNSEEVFTKEDYSSSNFLVKQSTINSLGKLVNSNPLATEKIVIQELGGVADREEFLSKAEALELPKVLDLAKEETEEDNTLFQKMQAFKRMPEMKIEGNNLTVINENDSIVQLEQTLKLSDDLSISSDIIYLNELSQDLYDENIEDVKKLIKEIEIKAAKQGVDITGLSDKVFSKSRDEIYDLLESLNTLLLEPSEQSFNDFIGQHQLVFETEVKPVTKVEVVSENNKNKSLTYLKTKLSEYTLFNDFGLLKVSENIYQRVEKEDLEILYNKLYDISQYNENILPLEAFPIATKDGAINLEALRNIENRELIVADIKRFIENEVSKLDVPSVSLDNTTLQQLVINKYAFEHPLTFTQTVDVQEEFNSFEAFDGKEEHLKTDFISDFYSDYLQEKIKNSEMYREFYINFSINEGGIVLVNDDAITTQKIKDYLAEKNIKKSKDLANYSLLTDQIPNLKATERDTSDYTRDFYRVNYSNNPMTLEKVKGDYKFLTDTTILKNNSVENFIRVKDRVFELIDTKGGNSFYEEIPVNISEYKVLNLSQPVLSVNIDNYGAERLDETQSVKAEKYYSKAEEQKINEESFECL